MCNYHLGVLLFLIVTNHQKDRTVVHHYFPHIFVCGVLVFGCALPPASACLPPSRPSPASHTTCSHTTCPHTIYSHTTCPHKQLTHTQLTHTQLVHTQLAHTKLTHTQLTHTQLAHTQLPLTQLVHAQLTHTKLTHTQLTPTQLPHTQLVHTTSSHTTCPHTTCMPLATSTFTLRGSRGTWRHGRAFCVAGVPLMALGWLWWRAWFPVDAMGAAAVCVAGVALGDIDLHFAWQAWHLATSTFTLRGRPGTWRHRRAFYAASVALMALRGLALVARLVPN